MQRKFAVTCVQLVTRGHSHLILRLFFTWSYINAIAYKTLSLRKRVSFLKSWKLRWIEFLEENMDILKLIY